MLKFQNYLAIKLIQTSNLYFLFQFHFSYALSQIIIIIFAHST